MSDLLIRGMEKPKTGRYFVAVDNTDGKDKIVISVMSEFERRDKTRPLLAVHEAVPVPPHGRLIDADALDADLERQDMHTGEWDAVGFSIEEIENAPTVIPAEEE